MTTLKSDALLTLLSLPGVGRRTVHKLLQKVSDLEMMSGTELLMTLREHLSYANLTQDLVQRAGERAKVILAESEQDNVRVISFGDEMFPPQLRVIPDPPIIVYAKGDIQCLHAEKVFAVVGTREPSPYGRKVAEALARKLAEMGVVVVSGLAEGCDTLAHKGCLSVGGRTVAVLAHGLHTVYPKKNEALAKEILQRNGCLFSEYPLGSRPFKQSFVERDRLQSGLSAGVIVIETDVKGGTMHTARFCREQNRRLGVVVHNEKYSTHAKAQGNKHLLENYDVVPIKEGDDLKGYINWLQDMDSPPPAKEISPRNKQLSFFDKEREGQEWG